MFTPKGRKKAEEILEDAGRQLAEIKTPELFRAALGEAEHIAHLTVVGKWEEGVVTRWKNGRWTSGVPVRKEHIEDGDLDMVKGNFDEYMRCLKNVDRRRRI